MNNRSKAFANVLLGVVLGVACGAVVAAQEATTPKSSLPESAGMGSPGDEGASVRGILKAMEAGDAKTLADLYASSKDPVTHVWAAMALERVHFNLNAATADAKVCQLDLLDSRPAIALLCGQFESGNLRLAGRAREADQLETELVARYQGRGLDRALDGMKVHAQSQSGQAALAIHQPMTTTTLNLKENAKSPVFTAKGNGHDFELMLDTGATNLVLGEKQAQALGVKSTGQFVYINGWLSKKVPAQRGILDTLQLGDIRFSHVPVEIVPDSIALIGANLMAPLGGLRISHSTLAIGANLVRAGTCETPMLTATDLWGQQLRIVPQLLINGAPHAVLLDTGAGAYLLGSKQALNEVTILHRGKTVMRDIGGRHPFANVKSAKVQLTIAGQPIDMTFTVYSDSDVRSAMTLGAGALRDMDFILDFQHQQLCFGLHPNLH